MEEETEEPEKPNSELEMLKKALDEEKKRSEEYITRLKYAQADFQNLKKRTDRQIDELQKYCAEHLVVQLLDIVDELELAVKSARSSDSNEALLQGVEMTLGKLKKTLEEQGVTPIECVGKPFDPSKQNAIERIEKGDVEECTVVEEVRKGYIMKEKVIRPSIVKVTVKPSSKSEEETRSDE
jgi:molecular chaperone GrpE